MDMNTRDTLLESALELFAAEGYSSVGVQRIIDAAGVKKPTLYHYFGSKEGLLQTLLQERFAPFLESLRRAALYSGDLVMTLESVISHYFRFTEEAPQIFRLLLALSFGPPEDASVRAALSLLGEQFSILEALFTAAIPDHGNLQGKEALLARTLYGMTVAYCGLALQEREGLDGDRMREVCRQFMHGIYC